MEPAGIEPATSCLQRAQAARMIDGQRRLFTGGFGRRRSVLIDSDARGLRAIVGVSGTYRGECLAEMDTVLQALNYGAPGGRAESVRALPGAFAEGRIMASV